MVSCKLLHVEGHFIPPQRNSLEYLYALKLIEQQGFWRDRDFSDLWSCFTNGYNE